MALSLQLGYPDVPKSITNPNVAKQYTLDMSDPMSFLTFIKTINVSFEPDVLQNYYNEYLKRWNAVKNKTPIDNRQIIIERYRDFIEDISINYTTLEEKKFLNQIDFNDPYDLDTIIPFYSRKLKEIAAYYNDKREKTKFEVTKKKIKGSNTGIQKGIVDITIDYLENIQDNQLHYNMDTIRPMLEVELEELYDTYPEYFNQIPNSKIYDDKDLDYGENIFLRDDSDLIADIFAGVSDRLKELKEVDQIFDNKRKLTEKYISTDFYYLSTGSTVNEFLSGKLFNADNPSGNFLNIDYPTTASTLRNSFKTPRQVGFFRPHKTSIVLIDGKNLSFSFNFDQLQPNSLYYFPDPKIHASGDDVLTFIVDTDYFKRNFSSGEAKNQPIYQQDNVSYYGYTSQYDINKNPNLNNLFDLGYIHDLKHDIYNNIFGLLKNDGNFEQSIQNVDTNTIKNLQLNGHTFYDELYGEGYNFDYSIYDDTTYKETIRSGLSSFTNGFSATGTPMTLFFRYFSPYEELIQPTENVSTGEAAFMDGAFFTKSNGEAYDDPISSDLAAFPGNGVYYFNTLMEGGLHTSNPIQRALLDPAFPSLTADYTQSSRPMMGNDTIEINGGLFTDTYNMEYEFDVPTYPYSSEVFQKTTYTNTASGVKESLFSRDGLDGHIYVKNNRTKQTNNLLDGLPYLKTKFPPSVVEELSGSILNFDLVNDVFFIETPSYLITDKIVFSNNDFVNPKTSNVIITNDYNQYNAISTRFKVKNDVYYCVMKTLTPTITSNQFVLYPEIYKLDLFNFKNELIFPESIADITNNTEFFTISGNDVRYLKCDQPVLTHSSRNNIFNISFILKDQNNHIFLQEYDFTLLPSIKFLNHKQYPPLKDQESNIFDATYTTTLTFNISAGNPTVSNEEFIL